MTYLRKNLKTLLEHEIATMSNYTKADIGKAWCRAKFWLFSYAELDDESGCPCMLIDESFSCPKARAILQKKVPGLPRDGNFGKGKLTAFKNAQLALHKEGYLLEKGEVFLTEEIIKDELLKAE